MRLGGRQRWWLMAIAWCVALNLRGISIAVSPVLPLIQADLGLSYSEAGLLFALPTFLLGVFGLAGGRLADTVGMKRTIALGLGVILVGSALRATSFSYASLTVWTLVLGAGMGLASPGLTRMVKDQFSDLPGTATGIYISGFIMGAALGSWLTVPYLLQWSGSWRGTFVVWSGLALLTLVGWIAFAPSAVDSSGGRPPSFVGIWRDPTVWKLNLIVLSQSLVFYSLSSWIPTYYQELGFSLDQGARVLTVFILVNLPSSLLVPYISDRVGGRRGSLLFSGAIIVLAMIGFAFFPLSFPWVSPVIIGLCMGGVFALTFALPLDYVEASRVGSVAGANLLVGYGGTFLGPLLIGWSHDVTSSFTAGWLAVIAFIIVLMASAVSLPRRPG